eukprot:TRINITY_DN4184_c0_g2_i1.p1 TRINITY_DN4184_c0_g2~~TRINITY_DN4184_c0_g2_i1.p1  ORF type:complete len:141 (-),score=16.62 TRINITY_DN4184_c0_g2_i1:226-648(-)
MGISHEIKEYLYSKHTKKFIETKFNREIKVPRSNNGGEYDCQIFFHLISILRISQNNSKFTNITPSLSGAKSLFLEHLSDIYIYDYLSSRSHPKTETSSSPASLGSDWSLMLYSILLLLFCSHAIVGYYVSVSVLCSTAF